MFEVATVIVFTFLCLRLHCFSFLTDTGSSIEVLFKFDLPHLLSTHPHDTHAGAIKRTEGKRKRKQVIVGHVPLTWWGFHLFFKHREQLYVQVTGKRKNKAIGLEILATYTFCRKKELKILKLKELLNDQEDQEVS